MKPANLLFLGFLLMAIACKNPKPDVIVNDNRDTTKVDSGDVAAPAEVDSATMMKAWMDYATPGDMHKWMAKYDGTWTGEVTAWMGDPNNPEKSTATSVQKMAFNGLYQMSDFTGTMMGQPFTGHSILAYDNAKKEFISTWIDNMGSGVLVMTGTLDTATNTLHLKGKQTDPVSGKDFNMREEVKFVDDNTQIISIFGPEEDGSESKHMEINLKRKM